MIYLGWFTFVLIAFSVCLFGAVVYRLIHGYYRGHDELNITKTLALIITLILVVAYINEITRLHIAGLAS